MIGNWSDFNTDLNGDGQYQSSNDRMVAGTFNGANEITQLVRTLQGGSPATLAFTYDKAGNLREQALNSRFTLRYTHDAWNRLVKVEQVDNGSTVATRGEYQYNGLGQRVVKRSDHDITDGTNALDEQRLLYYSAGWQIVEERIDDNYSGAQQLNPDRIVQHIWGLRYIDDLVLTRQDTTANGSYADKTDLNHYALTDHQFSVVARITNTGALVDRIAYTPYGEARHQWYNDVDGDGDVDAADNTAASNASGTAIYQSNYNVDADFDRDGDVDSNDIALVTSSDYRAALPGGWIASAGSAHTNGYCGYVFNQESGFYTVRFRHYDPQWGRWIERDPAGYMDSMSLYEYGISNPMGSLDPTGLVRIQARNSKGELYDITWERALELLEEGEDVYVDGSKKARRLAKKAFGAGNTVRHDAHEPGWHDHWQRKNGRRGHVNYRLRLLAFLAVLGVAAEAEAASEDMYILFARFYNTTDRANAELIAWDIAEELVRLYGSAGYLFQQRLMEAWDDIQSERAKERANRAHPSSPTSSPLHSDDPEAKEPQHIDPDDCQ